MSKRSKNKKRSETRSRGVPSGPSFLSPAFPWKTLLRFAVIVAAAVLVYGPALHGAWLWDDNLLITANPRLHDLAGLGQIWFAPPTNDYWPLSLTFLWIEWHLWGATPFPYHAVSLLLHLSSGLLIWRLLGRLGLEWGWLGGLLFVIHPVAVESVAWAAEIKNTLSLPFFLLACHAWLDAEEHRRGAFVKSVLYYLAAMLAKTSTVMVPAVLLLYCWWKRGGVTRAELRRMVPYAFIAIALGLVTVYFQNPNFFGSPVERMIHPVDLGGPLDRLLRAGTCVFFYLGKTLLPVGLVPVYPASLVETGLWLQLLTWPCLALLLVCLWNWRGGWSRHLLFGLGFFLINVLPVIGLVRMKYFEISWIADHLIYIALIGPIALVVAGLEELHRRLPAAPRRLAVAACAVLVAGLAWQSRAYASLFADPETLWTYAVKNGGGNFQAHFNLGEVLFIKSRFAEAAAQFRQSLELHPDDEKTLSNLGACLDGLGQRNEAIGDYRRALEVDPNCVQALANLATDLALTGNMPEAVEKYRKVLRYTPDDPQIHNNLGAALYHLGLAAEAVQEFETVVAINPHYPNIQKRLAAAQRMAASVPR